MMTINVESIKLGRTINHLEMGAFVPRCDVNRLYSFDFTGADLETNANMTQTQMKQLKEEFNKDFGYPPFDEAKARRIIGNGKQYSIKE